MTKHLSPRQFAEAIGVSESSVRRWADDGRIKMTRTAGGHRKIARSEAMRFIRTTAQNVVRPDLLQIAEPNHRHDRPGAFARQGDELFDALKNGEAEIVFGLLSRMYLNGVAICEICDGPLRHAMSRIGALWPNAENAILIEHRATSICIDAMNRMRSSLPRTESGAVRAVGGGPERDPYVLPSLMVTTVLADVGLEPVNLGPNTPSDVIAQAALDHDAHLAWVAVTSLQPKKKATEEWQQVVNRLRRKRIHLVLGGQNAQRITVPQSKYVHHLKSLTELAAFARTLAADSR